LSVGVLGEGDDGLELGNLVGILLDLIDGIIDGVFDGFVDGLPLLGI
jgi:hypothetical protein